MQTLRLVISLVPSDRPMLHLAGCSLAAGQLLPVDEDLEPLVQLQRIAPCVCLPPDLRDDIRGLARPY